MRCEANISLASQQIPNHKYQIPNYKVEIKNLNSFRFVKRAIEYEIERQTKILELKKMPVQETRGFDSKTGKTVSQRIKETAQDYRYFPEPDIPPIKWTQKYLKQLKNSLPELPDEKTIRFKKQYKLNNEKIDLLLKNKEIADYFEKVVKMDCQPEQAANLIINKPELLKFSPKQFIDKMKKEKMEIIDNESELAKIVKKIVKQNPKPVNDYQKGKTPALQYLMGQVMRKTRGKASVEIVKELLIKELE